ncbi:MAG: hypothetical protein KDC38_15090, partial [Planctomycetes bacterium]|nr:hypothetical protein [Planctomycetota bacterium]
LLAGGPETARAQKLGEVQRAAPTLDAPRGQALEWTSAEEKTYWYRLPREISAKQRPDLIFMLHGTGLNWGWSFWNYPIANGRFRGNDIIVSPEGMTPGQGDTFNFTQNKRDGDQIAGLIREFRSRFPIDKVYIYGHSQGAFFCYWFAGAYTELIDGIVAHAGNVLDVNHNALAKEKVAIGILHGKADAVVSVDCAYRTENVYRQQGYRKIKLYIVEGLNETSGHWPLPNQVAEMFEWLDEVNADTPRLASKVALHELAKESPDLRIIVESVAKARSGSKRIDGDDAETVRAQIDALVELVGSLETAHAEAIESARTLNESAEKGQYLDWMAHFVEAQRAFAGSKSWRKSLRSVLSKAGKQDRLAAAALKQITARQDRKALQQAIAAYDETPLSPEADELGRALLRIADAPPKGVDPAIFAPLRSTIQSRESAHDAGVAKARTITVDGIRKFRESHPELFATPDA